MRGRDKYCITTSGTNKEMWLDIRNVLGPIPSDYPDYLVLMNQDIAEYDSWVLTTAGATDFDKWLIWKIRVGTDRLGNLPKDKKLEDKIGQCWNPCPYSTQSSDLKTRLKLNLGDSGILPTKEDHSDINGTVYFMENIARGNRWGYECTFSGCTYLLDNGEKYFYV